jgi:hypothetical protein
VVFFWDAERTRKYVPWAECTIFRRVDQICEKRLLASSCLCLSVRIEQLCSHWTDSDKIYIYAFLGHLSRKFKFCSVTSPPPPKIVPLMRFYRKIWSQSGRRWQYSVAFHARLVRLHAHKHMLQPVHPSLPPPSNTRSHRPVCKTYCFSTATIVS